MDKFLPKGNDMWMMTFSRRTFRQYGSRTFKYDETSFRSTPIGNRRLDLAHQIRL